MDKYQYLRVEHVNVPKPVFPPKKSRKSIEWHKRRMLARFKPTKKNLNITIIQIVDDRGLSTLWVAIKTLNGRPLKHLSKNRYFEHHKVVRALKYLVDEGKLTSDMSNKEWEIQIALGTATIRNFVLTEIKDVSSSTA